jgi:hypothetical protein
MTSVIKEFSMSGNDKIGWVLAILLVIRSNIKDIDKFDNFGGSCTNFNKLANSSDFDKV